MSINMILAVGVGLAATAFAAAVNAADAANATVITFDNLPQAAYADYTQDGVTVDMLNNTGANDYLLVHETFGNGESHGAFLFRNWSLTIAAEAGKYLDLDSLYIRSAGTNANISAAITAYDAMGAELTTVAIPDIDFAGDLVSFGDAFNQLSSVKLTSFGPIVAGVDDITARAFVPVVEPPPAPVPEASAIVLMSLGFAALGGFAAFRRKGGRGDDLG